MSKTHAPANPTRYEEAMASGDIRRVLMLKAACGARATDRAQLDMTADYRAVDCGRCLKTPAYRYMADATERNETARAAKLEAHAEASRAAHPRPKRIASFPTNTELVALAIANAKAEGLPAPRTAEDVSTLTGFAYNGPDPEAVGIVQHPVVVTPEGRPVGRPAVGKLRTVRVPDATWEAAAAAAEAKGETVSEVIRRALELYVNAYPASITPGVVR